MDISGCVEFLQKLIRLPSLPGREGPLAELVAEEMRRLDYDEVGVDEAGNVIGLVRGSGKGRPVMLNTHLDHVDPGDPVQWEYPPYGGVLAQSRVWGRGAVDIKGPLAAQVHAVGQLVGEGKRPGTDVYVTAVVQEEVGGAGARFLASHCPRAIVVVGEPSGNQLRIGHRGRLELRLRASGRSVHASVPELGVNPLEVVSRFILGLHRIEFRHDPILGGSTCAPTLIGTDQSSPNVIPREAWVTIDWRNVPGESCDVVKRRLSHLAEECRIEGSQVAVEAEDGILTTYTGLGLPQGTGHPPFSRSETAPDVAAARGILRDHIGLETPPGIWRFATDGGHFHEAGLRVLGFGPGDDKLAHTCRESIGLAELEIGINAYQGLAAELGTAGD